MFRYPAAGVPAGDTQTATGPGVELRITTDTALRNAPAAWSSGHTNNDATYGWTGRIGRDAVTLAVDQPGLRAAPSDGALANAFMLGSGARRSETPLQL